MAYENLQKAISGGLGEGLSTQQKSDNYELFNKLMKDNVYLPDLVKKIDDLEKKVNEMDRPKENPIDAELFAVMEQAVKDDPAVLNAKRALQNEKTRVISELCVRDEKYREAFDGYRRAVNQAYVSAKEVKASVGE